MAGAPGEREKGPPEGPGCGSIKLNLPKGGHLPPFLFHPLLRASDQEGFVPGLLGGLAGLVSEGAKDNHGGVLISSEDSFGSFDIREACNHRLVPSCVFVCPTTSIILDATSEGYNPEGHTWPQDFEKSSLADFGTRRVYGFSIASPGVPLSQLGASPMFSRVQGLGQVLAILSRIKPSDISDFLAAVAVIGDQSKDLKDRVLAGLKLADIVTNYTETEADDAVVDFLKDAAQTEALWTIVSLVQDLLDGADPKTLEARQVGDLAYTGRGGEAKAVPWVLIVQVALMVFEFLQSRSK